MTKEIAGRNRFWEVDALRGLAVAAMVFFHFMWDLWYFGLTTQDIGSPPWQRLARAIGGTFIFVMGVAVAIRSSRAGPPVGPWLARRAAILLGLAALISIGTAVFAGDAWVRFGILHHAGLAMLLVIPFVRVSAGWNAAIGAGLFALGLWLNTLSAPFPWLLPLGVPQAGVAMLDYYPLLPWFGLVLAGLAAGQALYPGGEARFRPPDLSGWPIARGLGWLGRHSLAVYIVHQPVLIGALFVARGAGWL